ncbi:MAG: hypothetical protein JWR32_4964 [Mycobacterium sp.]|nr:hypothetical protein [Mycobacterium sp.]
MSLSSPPLGHSVVFEPQKDLRKFGPPVGDLVDTNVVDGVARKQELGGSVGVLQGYGGEHIAAPPDCGRDFIVGDGDQCADDSVEHGWEGGVIVQLLGELLKLVRQLRSHAPRNLWRGHLRDIESAAFEGWTMKGLRFDESGWLGLYFPDGTESGWSAVDKQTEVVVETCGIVAEHFGAVYRPSSCSARRDDSPATKWSRAVTT